jgi:hypothetical protein
MSFEEQLKPPAIRDEAEAGRSRKVRQHIENIKQTMSTVQWDLGELLAEATEKNYFTEWGYENRKAYVEENLDIKDRQAWNLIRIVSLSSTLGYTREQIEPIGNSKNREIFSLEPDQSWVNPETQIAEPIVDHMHRLISLAPTLSYEAILAEVRKLKGIVGDNDLTWMNFQVTRIVKDNVCVPGLNAFRAYMGSKGIVGPDGGKEYSDAFVIEHIFAEILSGAQVQEPEIEDEIQEIPTE